MTVLYWTWLDCDCESERDGGVWVFEDFCRRVMSVSMAGFHGWLVGWLVSFFFAKVFYRLGTGGVSDAIDPIGFIIDQRASRRGMGDGMGWDDEMMRKKVRTELGRTDYIPTTESLVWVWCVMY